MIGRLAAVLGVIVAGVAVRTLTDGWFAKYAGVALYATMIYALVVLVAPRIRPFAAGAVALGLSWAVEFAQLSRVPAILAEIHPLLRVAFGATFSAADLPAYLVGAALGVAAHLWAARWSARM
jgi:hypothetical protein